MMSQLLLWAVIAPNFSLRNEGIISLHGSRWEAERCATIENVVAQVCIMPHDPDEDTTDDMFIVDVPSTMIMRGTPV